MINEGLCRIQTCECWLDVGFVSGEKGFVDEVESDSYYDDGRAFVWINGSVGWIEAAPNAGHEKGFEGCLTCSEVAGEGLRDAMCTDGGGWSGLWCFGFHW